MVKVFFSIAQTSALYGLLRPYGMDYAADDTYNLMAAQLETIKKEMLKKLIAAAENRKQYLTLKFTTSQAYSLRIVLSNIGWVEPLADSVRVYLLSTIDSKLP